MPNFFKVETKDVRSRISDLLDKDAAFVTAYALTKTARDIEAAEWSTMQSVFDRPTN